jgi:hypothetical protein
MAAASSRLVAATELALVEAYVLAFSPKPEVSPKPAAAASHSDSDSARQAIIDARAELDFLIKRDTQTVLLSARRAIRRLAKAILWDLTAVSATDETAEWLTEQSQYARVLLRTYATEVGEEATGAADTGG